MLRKNNIFPITKGKGSFGTTISGVKAVKNKSDLIINLICLISLIRISQTKNPRKGASCFNYELLKNSKRLVADSNQAGRQGFYKHAVCPIRCAFGMSGDRVIGPNKRRLTI